MKRALQLFIVIMLGVMLAACGGNSSSDSDSGSGDSVNAAVLDHHFADKDEAAECFLSHEDYFNGMTENDLQYRLQDKNVSLDEYKEFGKTQMEEFTDEEKAVIEETFKDMSKDLSERGCSLPELEEITMIKSTQQEECGSGAYTHGTQIFLGQDVIDMICSDDKDEKEYGRSILWHEVFHCLTRCNPDFRKDMYKILHFTVQDEEYVIPPSVLSQYISNPDVGHHNSHATFKINGEDVKCFVALISTKPFEKKGDSFFDCFTAVLVPVDGSDVYYMPEDAENFWEVFGENTDYVIDPEECLADNFSFAMTYGMEGQSYKNPEITQAIIDYLSENK